jgi:AraC-like DNA-binding protein
MEPQLIDAAAPARRAALWRDAVPRVFEGLRVDASARTGRVATRGFGPGRLATIAGGAQRVTREAPRASDQTARFFNVLVQLEGRALATHAGRAAELGPGDFVLVDGSAPFVLEFGAPFAQLLFQLPRDLVLRRHAGLSRHAGRRAGREAGPHALVGDALRATAGALDGLGPAARAHAFDACLGLLGVTASSFGPGDEPPDRYALALADIDAALADPDLSPASVAARQGIGRRRLDLVFARHGTTIAAAIRERRLLRAAANLEDPALAGRLLIDVAFSCGFNDAAHFSRAFRRRFGTSPGEWRRCYGRGA